jgi:xanthine dehydrogenase accessory factor
VVRELRDEGVTEDLIETLDTPAGLDIGARTPAEVALAIVARIIAVRRSEHEAAPVGSAVTAVDPICGMTVVVAGDTPSVEHEGVATYFCCTGCRRKFEERREPARSDG